MNVEVVIKVDIVVVVIVDIVVIVIIVVVIMFKQEFGNVDLLSPELTISIRKPVLNLINNIH